MRYKITDFHRIKIGALIANIVITKCLNVSQEKFLWLNSLLTIIIESFVAGQLSRFRHNHQKPILFSFLVRSKHMNFRGLCIGVYIFLRWCWASLYPVGTSQPILYFYYLNRKLQMHIQLKINLQFFKSVQFLSLVQFLTHFFVPNFL